MSRGPQKFRKRDVTRALQAAAGAGFDVARVEIQQGKIVLFAANQNEDEAAEDGGPTWEELTGQ